MLYRDLSTNEGQRLLSTSFLRDPKAPFLAGMGVGMVVLALVMLATPVPEALGLRVLASRAATSFPTRASSPRTAVAPIAPLPQPVRVEAGVARAGEAGIARAAAPTTDIPGAATPATRGEYVIEPFRTFATAEGVQSGSTQSFPALWGGTLAALGWAVGMAMGRRVPKETKSAAASFTAVRVPYQPRIAAMAMSSQDELKKQVGYQAVDDHVQSGMVVGLGTGSTAAFAVERLGQKLKSGELKDIIAIPTSVRTKEQAESLGIPLTSLAEHPVLDVAIDGADAVDPDLNLVKGGGGALLREKMVEVCAKKFICIVDESKLCDALGPSFPIPVEITPFEHEHTRRLIAALPEVAGCKAILRMGSSSTNVPDGDEIAVTDNGNYIVDLKFDTPVKDAVAAANALKNMVGVVDHGFFIGMTTACIVAGSKGVYSLPK